MIWGSEFGYLQRQLIAYEKKKKNEGNFLRGKTAQYLKWRNPHNCPWIKIFFYQAMDTVKLRNKKWCL